MCNDKERRMPAATFATTFSVVTSKSSLERATRIELAFSAWEAGRQKTRVGLYSLVRGVK